MAVIGIDLGALTTKVGSVGKNGLHMVRNEQSSRETPEQERLIGDAAQTVMKRYYNKTVNLFTHLVGVTPEDTGLIEYENNFTLAPIVTVDKDKHVAFDLGDVKYTSVQVLVPFLKKLKAMSEEYLGVPICNCVCATPLFYTEKNRDALRVACTLAGLNCTEVISQINATAINYNLLRRNTLPETPVRLAILDIGYSQATFAIIDFSKSGYTFYLSEENITLGSRELDKILAEKCAEVFKQQKSLDIHENKKSYFKLVDACVKAKKVLSANRSTRILIEGLMNDVDFEFTITREEFEDLCQNYRDRFENFIKNSLECKELDASTIHNVELVGGGSRVPFIVDFVEQLFGKTAGRTISGDECSAIGSAIAAASLDARFKVTPVKMQTFLKQNLTLTFEDALQKLAYDNNSITLAKGTPKNVTSLILLGRDKPHTILFEKTVQFLPSPDSKHLVTFNLTLDEHLILYGKMSIPPNVQKAFGKSPEKCRFRFKVSRAYGDVYTVSCTFIETVDKTEKYTEKVPKLDEDGQLIENEFDEVEKTREKTVNRNTEMTVDFSYHGYFLNNDEIAKIRDIEEDATLKDENCAKARNIRNEILSECFRIRDAVFSDSSVYAKFVTPEEADEIKQTLYDCEDYAEYNLDSTIDEYNAELNKLKSLWQPIEERFRQANKKESDNVVSDEDLSQMTSDLTSSMTGSTDFGADVQDNNMDANVENTMKD